MAASGREVSTQALLDAIHALERTGYEVAKWWDGGFDLLLTLPLGESADGLPIGIHLVAAYGREDLLIRVASQLETAAPWAHKRPPGY